MRAGPSLLAKTSTLNPFGTFRAARSGGGNSLGAKTCPFTSTFATASPPVGARGAALAKRGRGASGDRAAAAAISRIADRRRVIGAWTGFIAVPPCLSACGAGLNVRRRRRGATGTWFGRGWRAGGRAHQQGPHRVRGRAGGRSGAAGSDDGCCGPPAEPLPGSSPYDGCASIGAGLLLTAMAGARLLESRIVIGEGAMAAVVRSPAAGFGRD